MSAEMADTALPVMPHAAILISNTVAPLSRRLQLNSVILNNVIIRVHFRVLIRQRLLLPLLLASVSSSLPSASPSYSLSPMASTSSSSMSVPPPCYHRRPLPVLLTSVFSFPSSQASAFCCRLPLCPRRCRRRPLLPHCPHQLLPLLAIAADHSPSSSRAFDPSQKIRKYRRSQKNTPSHPSPPLKLV